ncbi:hypothetical protein Tco_0378647 [Tanacetum coccineum]
MVVHNHEEMGKGPALPIDPHHTPIIIQPSTSQPQKTQKPRRSKRKDTEVPQPCGPITNVADEAINEEMDDSLVRVATTASSGGPRRQETMGDTISQTRFENVSKHSHDLLLASGNTLQSGEDSLKLQELMALCTTLQSRVLNLETTKTTQANEIAMESSDEEGLGEDDASKQGRIADIDANEDIYLVNVQTDEDMFGVNDLDGDEVIVESVDVVNTAEETRSVVEEVTAVTIPGSQKLLEGDFGQQIVVKTHYTERSWVKQSSVNTVGIKRLFNDLEVTAAKVCVTAAKQKLVLFSNLNEKYAK